ncbi:hypothetical protein B4119_3809 [Parageobacillus caldoxylosilyticus]|uniref:Uncharacterized protein n=1 Tax=Saccharococcus caldoxylosilyticus TaxID=81408 RepID=A0A150M4D2_9BACL|nr:hypothetical protein B4119_3809 [Parageobacillus caldoxylosilyticus]
MSPRRRRLFDPERLRAELDKKKSGDELPNRDGQMFFACGSACHDIRIK